MGKAGGQIKSVKCGLMIIADTGSASVAKDSQGNYYGVSEGEAIGCLYYDYTDNFGLSYRMVSETLIVKVIPGKEEPINPPDEETPDTGNTLPAESKGCKSKAPNNAVMVDLIFVGAAVLFKKNKKNQ